MEIKVFPTPELLAGDMSARLAEMINASASDGRIFSLAVSGGNTPRLLFESLAANYADKINWDFLRLFWVDERCVPPDSDESNYGTMRRILLDRISLGLSHAYRMKGEEDPEQEARRYSDLLVSELSKKNGLPFFDLVLLGMGDDGHTASIFPGNLGLIDTDSLCAVAANPYSGQKRITLTGKVINNAGRVAFLVTGRNKSTVAEKILTKTGDYLNFPASYISPSDGIIEWIFDEEAGSFAIQK